MKVSVQCRSVKMGPQREIKSAWKKITDGYLFSYLSFGVKVPSDLLKLPPRNKMMRTTTFITDLQRPCPSLKASFSPPSASMPMQSVPKGTLIAGKGLEGDRYCQQVGTYSVFRISKLEPGQREPGRQLTLISADSVEAAFERNGLNAPDSLGDLRRNIVVRGLSSDDLLGAVGHVIQLGETCRVLVHRHCVPCIYNERKNGIKGMMEAIWNEAGVSCQVLVGGHITVGDTVEILCEKQQVDDGYQPPGYYVPPSKRTAEMVKEAIEKGREGKKQLLEIDPEGVKRVDASYGTVGLTFWPRDKV